MTAGRKKNLLKFWRKTTLRVRPKFKLYLKKKTSFKDAMEKKISEFKASNVEKDGRIASLKAKLNRAREEYKAEMTKIRQESIEAIVNFNLAQI